MIYKIWLFFMDSNKGRTKYFEECRIKEQAPKYSGAYVTWAPYPGRFKWRKWKITKFLKNWKLKRKGLYKHIDFNIKLTPIELERRELKVKWVPSMLKFPEMTDIEKELISELAKRELELYKNKMEK